MPDPASPLAAALRHAEAFFSGLDRRPVAATADLATLRRRLGAPLADDGLPAAQVVDDLARGVEGGLLGSAGGRFFAWVIGGSLPAALAADWLASAWEQNAAIYECSPAASVAEEIAGTWLKDLLGLPASAAFALVTGCQMAHVTCLAAARHATLAARGWDVEQHGLYGAPPVRILCGLERHGTVDRALRLLGLGRDHLEPLPVDDQGRLAPAALAQALDHPGQEHRPTIVVLQAGELNLGAYDDFQTLIPVAHRHRAWVHIDGAFGMWAAASPRLRHLLAGAAAADSWATDGHKLLNVPYDCGYAFVAEPQALRSCFRYDAPYVPMRGDARDQIDWNPEWSRRARGFATYAALRQLGRRGLARQVETCCDHARALVAGLAQLPGAELVAPPLINQGLVRFLDPKGKDHDRRTDQVIAAINATGEAFFGGTTWRGRRAMRVSVCNWRTTAADVDRAIAAAARVLA